MKRFHLSIATEDMTSSIEYYSSLLNQRPSFVRDDYAKWMIDSPALNLSLNKKCGKEGIQHVGIQFDDKKSLVELTKRVEDMGRATLEEDHVRCCYAVSDKTWSQDPNGVSWEAFLSYEQDFSETDAEANDIFRYQTEPFPNNSCCSDS